MVYMVRTLSSWNSGMSQRYSDVALSKGVFGNLSFICVKFTQFGGNFGAVSHLMRVTVGLLYKWAVFHMDHCSSSYQSVTITYVTFSSQHQ